MVRAFVFSGFKAGRGKWKIGGNSSRPQEDPDDRGEEKKREMTQSFKMSIKPLCGTFEILKVSFRFFFLIRKFKHSAFVLFSLFVILYSHCCTSCVE